MTEQFVPVLVMFGIAAFVVVVILVLGKIVSPHNRTPIKERTFECGNEASGPAWGRFSVKFYLTAILFIVFDIEVVFMYPWAIRFRELGWFGLAEMAVFIGILALGLAYVWRKGALEWE